MGATAAVSGVLGAANVIGGSQKAAAERRAANAQAKTQAMATRQSLLAQRQSLIDQASLQEMQLRANQQYATQQSMLAELDIQNQVNQQKAQIQAQSLLGQMNVAEQRFNNQASLTNAEIGAVNAQSQANKGRTQADLQEMQMQQQGRDVQQGVARQGEQAFRQAEGELEKVAGAYDQQLAQQGAQGFNSSAQANQQTAMVREASGQLGELTQRQNLQGDLAQQQSQYLGQVASILKNLGYSEADAMEAASVAQMSLAKAGYDLNNINLDAALSQLSADTETQKLQLAANEGNQRQALNIDRQAQQFNTNLGLASNQSGLATGLVNIEAQARANTFQMQQAPSLLSQAVQIGTGAYNTYQNVKQASLLGR